MRLNDHVLICPNCGECGKVIARQIRHPRPRRGLQGARGARRGRACLESVGARRRLRNAVKWFPFCPVLGPLVCPCASSLWSNFVCKRKLCLLPQGCLQLVASRIVVSRVVGCTAQGRTGYRIERIILFGATKAAGQAVV